MLIYCWNTRQILSLGSLVNPVTGTAGDLIEKANEGLDDIIEEKQGPDGAVNGGVSDLDKRWKDGIVYYRLSDRFSK